MTEATSRALDPSRVRNRTTVRAFRRRCSGLLAVGPELLEIGDDIVNVLFLRQTREDHLGAWNLAARVLQIFLQGRLVPSDAGILVGIAIGVARISTGLAANDAVEHRSNGILGALADLVASPAFEKHLLAKSGILSARGTPRACKCEGSENVNL